MKNKNKKNRFYDNYETRKANIDQGKPERLLETNKWLSNRDLAIKILLVLGIIIFFILNGLLNYFPILIKNILLKDDVKFKFLNIFWIKNYVFLFFYSIIYFILSLSVLYKQKVSFGSLNVGQKGTTRWTTDEELKEQYVSIPSLLQMSSDTKFVYFDVTGETSIEQESNYVKKYSIETERLSDLINTLRKNDIGLVKKEDLNHLEECLDYIKSYTYNFDKHLRKCIYQLIHIITEIENLIGNDMSKAQEEQLDLLIDTKNRIEHLRGCKAPYDYEGISGIPISWDRQNERIYIDQTYTNFFYLGVSRSSKGEAFVTSTMDTLTRAKDKPSIVAIDPKLEVAKMSADTLKERGYIIWMLNLVIQEESMGFAPLYLIVNYYRERKYAQAELLCKNFAISIYNPDKKNGDTFWDDNSVAACTAMILAITDDCITADIHLRNHFDLLKEEYTVLLDSPQIALMSKIFKSKTNRFNTKINELAEMMVVQAIASKHETVDEYNRFYIINVNKIEEKQIEEWTNEYYSLLGNQLEMTIDEFKYWLPIYYTLMNNNDISYYEQKINMYSMLLTFSQLQRTVVNEEKVNETFLDVYFNQRGDFDRAKLKWASIEVAGEKTRGSIFSSMLTQLEIFTYEEIAKITSTNEMDLAQLGFGKRPIALFLGVPDYDKSFHFLCTILITQYYFVVSQKATVGTGKTDRDIVLVGDEIFNVPKIPNFQEMLNVQLGRKMRALLFAQSYSQIPLVYGDKEAETILKACHNRIYIMGGNEEEANKFAKDIGEETVTSLNRNGERLSLDKSITEMQEAQPLIRASELMELAEGESVVKRILHRKTLNNEDHIQTPIFNRNNRRFKLRYQYLKEYFPDPDTIDLRKCGIVKTLDVTLMSKTYNTTRWIELKKGENNEQEKTSKECIWDKKIRVALEKKLNEKFNVLWEICIEEVFNHLDFCEEFDLEEVLDMKVSCFFNVYIQNNELQRMGYSRQSAKLKKLLEKTLISQRKLGSTQKKEEFEYEIN